MSASRCLPDVQFFKTLLSYCRCNVAAFGALVLANELSKGASNNRRHRRQAVSKTGIIVHVGGATSFVCQVTDMSEGGARIRVSTGYEVPKQSFFIDMHARAAHDADVAWNGYPYYGLKLSNRMSLSDVAEEFAYLRKIWFAHASR
jgi:PilZ domain